MSLHHLHLHVRDRPRAVEFYRHWFGLVPRNEGENIVFLVDERGFLLALMDDASPQPMPPWFHFGFRQVSVAVVEALHAAMQAAGVEIVLPLSRRPELVAFRLRDPEGYLVEVYWQANRPGAAD